MSEQLGEKHSAPAPSPSREQGKKKKAKEQQQTTISFMPRTKAKDLDSKMEMFKCVEKLIKETNGESLEPLANDYKEKIEFFQSSTNESRYRNMWSNIRRQFGNPYVFSV